MGIAHRILPIRNARNLARRVQRIGGRNAIQARLLPVPVYAILHQAVKGSPAFAAHSAGSVKTVANLRAIAAG